VTEEAFRSRKGRKIIVNCLREREGGLEGRVRCDRDARLHKLSPWLQADKYLTLLLPTQRKTGPAPVVTLRPFTTQHGEK
jgi:hypothetical protein